MAQVQAKDETQTSWPRSSYDRLAAGRVGVLWDDRDERPGVKFADAELIGCPVRVTVGRRAGEGIVESGARAGGETEEVAVDDLPGRVAELWQEAARLGRLLRIEPRPPERTGRRNHGVPGFIPL